MPVTAFVTCMAFGLGVSSAAPGDTYNPGKLVIVKPASADWYVNLAAEQLRRYAYLRTGLLPTLADAPPVDGPAVILRTGESDKLPQGGPDPAQNHAVYVESRSPLRIVVHGASPVSTLWAAYSLVESWGIGFYLGGDAIPKQDAEFTVAPLEKQYSPALAIRGSLPWFTFMNSPTTWNPQDYMTFFNQVSKQKANFVGFHVYDHEPFCAYNITNAKATMGGPLMTTISPHRWWSPPAMSTKDFLFGTDQFFDRGEWGCEVGIEDAWAYAPGRAVKLQQQMMAEALHYGRLCGIKTCIGFEATGNPDDPKAREAFRARLRHTLATYPLDYFWVWQSEGIGTGGADEKTGVDADIREAFAYLGKEHNLAEAARITKFVRLAHETLKELTPNVRLIVSGWGGDEWMRFTSLYEGLDKVVPDDIIFAALDNIDPRLADHVSQVYGKLKPGRESWPIPWFESDGGHTRSDQTGPQTNVTAFEPLLADIVKKKCRGALGIHWRTRNVEDVAGYLYRFGWNPELTAAEFFRQYASDQYGPQDADYMTQVHLRLEEYGPQYVGAIGCVECSTPFTWFVPRGEKLAGQTKNVAGNLPIPERLDKLDKLAAELAQRGEAAGKDGRNHAAQQYHDLSCMIKWLVTRARVGMAIASPSAPLEKKLREAERIREQDDGRPAARAKSEVVLKELQALEFDKAFCGFASTCRTRGELGMLATANARYGRYYAAFMSRAARVCGREDPPLREWKGSTIKTLLLVPDWLGEDQEIGFDYIRLPVLSTEVPVMRMVALGTDAKEVTRDDRFLIRTNAACYRFDSVDAHGSRQPTNTLCRWTLTEARTEEEFGFTTIRVASDEELEEAGIGPIAKGIGFVSSPIGRPQPSYTPPAPRQQQEPVLELRFDKPLGEVAEVIGEPKTTDGPHGKALDLRNGGLLKLPSDRAKADFDGPFTIMFFVRPEPFDSERSWPVLLSKGEWQSTGWFVQLYRGKLRVSLGGDQLLDTTAPEPGRWTHVAVVFDGEAVRTYLDGRETGVLEGVSAPEPSERALLIGAHHEPGQPDEFPFRGCLDEIVLYRRALSEKEIAAEAK